MSNDLDFDELHEQVSKLMDQATKPKKKARVKVADKSEDPQPAAEPAKAESDKVEVKQSKPAEPAKTEAPKEEPKPVTPEEKPAERQEEVTPVAVRRPAPAIVPRRQGIAMDIVQPAKQAQVAPPSVRASRTSPTLQPTGPVEPEPPRPRETTAPVSEAPKHDEVSDETLASLNLQSDSKPRPAAAAETVPAPDHAKATFPDPLEVHGFGGEEEKKPDLPDSPPTMEHKSVVEPDKETEEEAASVETADTSATPEASGTPFVNAKVEKRPLGAFAATPAPDAPAAEPEAPVTTEVTTDDEAPKEEKPAEVPTTPTPKELDPALVAVESSEPEFTPVTPPAPKPNVNELRQMAIPPQYKATEAEPSKDDRPIFDTKTYHPPIAPVAKAHKGGGSKAGMVLTLILILLIVIAGVLAYFMATGAIDVDNLLKLF